jgi:hypothetical protein
MPSDVEKHQRIGRLSAHYPTHYRRDIVIGCSFSNNLVFRDTIRQRTFEKWDEGGDETLYRPAVKLRVFKSMKVVNIRFPSLETLKSVGSH